MISVEDVAVKLGATTILEDVSLSVDRGEFLALVGPNGAGKTTLLRTCNGLLSPSVGMVTVDDHDVSTLSARAVGQLVATVPQETTLAFDFDVGDVVAMGRTPHRSRFSTATAEDREAVDAALERTETGAFENRSVGELSGGERQRVLIARALAQKTPVLLLDEPTASLDINHQVRTLSLARSLADDGKTIVAAIHDLGLAARFCDRIAILADGTMLDAGRPDDVLTSAQLELAFDVRTAVTTNPMTGTRTVTPLTDVPPGDRHVHVIGHGERAARVIGRLVDAGIEVSVGVIPEGDVATTTARNVASSVVTAEPFEPVDASKRREAETLCDAADVTVLATPVDRENRRLAAGSDRLVALEGAEPPASAQVVEDHQLLSAIRQPWRVQSTTRS